MQSCCITIHIMTISKTMLVTITMTIKISVLVNAVNTTSNTIKKQKITIDTENKGKIIYILSFFR